ncbi:hypothetical protein SAMN04488000_101692 [Lentzea albida]|uniref:Uncharacterized protein n=1 Tax=Lentzea albida TaxID=65499 RepID=A0A1H9BV36_9PSEU|nr:hypothetical protein SAMN04488000_101692 [Lentzea albida]
MGLERKLWTTRDLQEAAAAGALEDFESEEDDEDDEVDFVSDDFVSEEDEVDDEDVLFDEPERLSVR